MTKSSDVSGERKVRVAVIGYGLAGSVFHAPLIAYTPGMEVAAIVTSNESRQAAARADFPDARIFDNAEQLWENADEYQLCVIATPNQTHAPLAMAALKARINVVIDKPMAVSSTECEAIIACAKSNERIVSVFQNRRWDGDFLTVSLLVRSNNLGPINRFESRFERWRPVPRSDSWREKGGAEEGGGLLYDLGSHLIDQALCLFGVPETVYAETNVRREGVNSDDDCFIALTFPGGVRAHLWASAIARKQAPRFRLSGMLGSFEKYGIDPQEDALRAGRRPNNASWGAEPSEYWGTIAAEREGLNYEGRVETLHGDYPAFYKQMREAILNGSRAPVPGTDGLLTLRVIEAARRSADEGTVVRLEPNTVSA